MTDKASQDAPDMARFLQDWTALWRDELRAQSNEPGGARAGMAEALEAWRAAMTLWAGAMAPPPVRDASRAAGAEAAGAASDAVADAIRHLTRRVDELEARLARLEAPRRRRG